MGTPGKAVPSDDVLRAAVRRAWEVSGASLHTLGDEIGLSPAGLLKFINGSNPRAGTRKKLLDWYTGQPPVQGEPALPAAERMYDRLFPGLTEEDHAQLMRAAARAAADIYRRRGTTPPLWITDLPTA